MCGIAAIFNYATGEPINPQELARIRDQMRVRGPDSQGLWISERGFAGLGHTRLSILDLSERGSQPMISADGNIVLAYNGEIYNYRELRRELERDGVQFRSNTDTEILLHLYQTQGRSMVTRLRGMFSFALWDGIREGMFLARDPFGIKPLYLADDGKTLRIASQVKALLKADGIDTRPEPAGHAGFCLWGYVPSPYSLYKGIRALGAGETCWVSRGSAAKCEVYYDLVQALRGAEDEAGAFELTGGKATLRDALKDTVRHHLIADVPTGVFLSSGLDSTSITALATESSRSVRTVTLGFEEYRGTSQDETKGAEQIAQHCGTEHETVWVRQRDFQEHLRLFLQAMDQPSCDGVNTYFVSYAARKSGLKVALSGVGGDEIFGGYPSFHEIPKLVRALQPMSVVPGVGSALRRISSPLLSRVSSPKYAGLLEYGGSYGGAFLLRRAIYMPWELPQLIGPDLAEEGISELESAQTLNRAANQVNSPFFKVAALELTHYLRSQLLRDTDWASMAHSLEVRTPLVDSVFLQRVLPLLASPSRPNKQSMARASFASLPEGLLGRPKTGFTVPIRSWIPESYSAERGLRGWLKYVYAEYSGNKSSSVGVDSTRGTAPRRAGKRTKVAVFRIGQLGDTVVALPAFWAVRKHFADADITLITDFHAEKNYVSAVDLVEGSGLFQDFERYPARLSGPQLLVDAHRFWRALRGRRYDCLVYLAPSARTWRQVQRDRLFFGMAGARRIIGCQVLRRSVQMAQEQAVQTTAIHEADFLLSRVASGGIPTPRLGEGCMDLELGEHENREVAAWLGRMGDCGGRKWVAIGPGSKMPAKRWPLERFVAVARWLAREKGLWPVIFGGKEDADTAAEILGACGVGFSAAGELSVRGSASALARCSLYVGNDSGTMHLAAAVGTPCVAIFSARDLPGRWNPYGQGHVVLRKNIECAGCLLSTCTDRKNACLDKISVDDTIAACQEVLARG